MTSLKDETRAVYDGLHREQLDDDAIFERFVSLTSPSYFGVEENHFRDKTVLDAGCGTNANAAYALLQAGAEHVCALDVGERWMTTAREVLADFEGRFTLVAGDVEALPFEADRFDFVHCSGVLHHVETPEQGFRELARVTRPGGRLYVGITGVGGGIVYAWVNLLRMRYREDASFRRIVDGLSVEQLQWWVEWLLAERRAHEATSPEEEAFFRSLFDRDLVLTIKDRLQAPTCHEFAFTEDQVRGWYGVLGFEAVERLTRYPRGIGNVRRFLAPLYYRYESPLARLLFGDGFIQLIGTKSVPPPA
ncbi:MAG: methyltransferase domain-containing protein [Bacteroidetes bacterium]|nr:methyltransferase domain-containing protein [Bacteroidota bacterium]